MSPFQIIDTSPEYKSVEAYMNAFKVDYAEATRMRDLMLLEQFFVNDTYQVNISYVKSPLGKIMHLSIKRLDNEPVHSWKDIQNIKNSFAGPECEGFEIFPAESRLVDCSNQYHCWCFTDPSIRIPIGWTSRRVASEIRGDASKVKPSAED